MSTIIKQILRNKEIEVAASKRTRPLADLQKMIADAPPVRSFRSALGSPFGIIAEIKKRAPSRGDMRPENVEDAPEAYERSSLVKAISILTDNKYFGMSIERLREIRATLTKPVLRKDFIIDEYQIHEARAFGADAILLMANVLDRARLHAFYEIARQLGLDVLFESHTAEQIAYIPTGAEIYGINCRKFESKTVLGIGRYKVSRLLRRLWHSLPDLSAEYEKFALIERIPAQAIKVAESGVNTGNIAGVRRMGYNAALIGNSLLCAPEGIANALARFQEALDDRAGASAPAGIGSDEAHVPVRRATAAR